MSNYKVSKLWSKPWFLKYDTGTKLIYITLATRPSINSLGLFVGTPEELCRFCGVSLKVFNRSVVQLIKDKVVSVYEVEGLYWFHVLDYMASFPSKGPRFKTLVNQYNKLPAGLRQTLNRKFDLPRMEVHDDFLPPTPKDIEKYAAENGHIVDGEKFVSFYGSRDWKDSKGNRVKNWKQKVLSVWCREENKIPEVQGAPEGYKTFFVQTEDGPVFPERWKGGVPYGKSLIEDRVLQKGFKEQ